MVELLKIREHNNIACQAAEWFHQKWGIPLEAYTESIKECLNGESVVPHGPYFILRKVWMGIFVHG